MTLGLTLVRASTGNKNVGGQACVIGTVFAFMLVEFSHVMVQRVLVFEGRESLAD